MAHFDKNPISRVIKTKEVTVYIGRFSPFHLGHAHVLRQALQTSELVVVLVGSSGQSRSLKNPFTFAEREKMIMRWFDSEGLKAAGHKIAVRALRDYPYNDTLWTRSVQDKVKKAMNDVDPSLKEVHITGSDRDESTWYLNAFPQYAQALQPAYRTSNVTNVSATEVRKWMFEGSTFAERYSTDADIEATLPETTLDFIRTFRQSVEYANLTRWWRQNKAYKQSWAVAPYAPTFITADAVVIQSGHVLVVERGAEPGQGLWALPGGFVKQLQRVKNAAIDETMEETGIRLAEGKKAKELTVSILAGSIRDKEIFDAPNRSERGRTITVAYLFRLDDTKPLPKVKGQNMPLDETGGKIIVETSKAFWITIEEALRRTDMWFEDHLSILEWAVTVPDHR